MTTVNRIPLNTFEEAVTIGDFVMVNDLYEDDEVTKNHWMWGRIDSDCVVNPIKVDGLSSNTYAPFQEVYDRFLEIVEQQQ